MNAPLPIAEAEVRLGRLLTGVEEVSSRLVRSMLARARERFGEERIDALLAVVARGESLGAITASTSLLEIAKSLAYGLYTGLLPDLQGTEMARHQSPRRPIPAAEDYFESVVWRVIQAHPPGLSNAYFGHWHYPPEDLHPTTEPT